MALFACKKNKAWELYQPDTTFSRTGKVSLLATFENLQTKLTMDDGGHGLWSAGEELAVALSDGEFVTFSLDGTGETRRAVFTGQIPEGKTLGSVAVYPASAVQELVDDKLTLAMPGLLADVSYPGILVGAIGDSWELDFKQALGFLRLTINNVPAGAAKIKFSAGNAISGLFTASVSDILSKGLAMKDGQGPSVLEYPVPEESGSSLYLLLPLPADEYKDIELMVYDNKNKLLLIQTLSDYAINLSRAELRRMTVALDDVAAPPCRIHLGTDRIEMQATSPNVYEGTYEVPAETNFTIEFDGVPYGFAAYSGAGGLGLISDGASALPALRIKQEGKSKKTYYVDRAIGTLAPTESTGHIFRLNLESPGKMHVVADKSDEQNPKYSIHIVKEADPSVLFHEDFALCTHGGDYIAVARGSGGIKLSTYDGYLPAVNDACTANQSPVPFDYPAAASAGNVAKESFMQAYGLSQWVFSCAGERPNALQLCTSTLGGSMTTPALSSVSGTIDAVLTLDMARFSTASTAPVYIRILNAGVISSATVVRDAFTSASQSESYPQATTAYTDFGDDGNVLTLADDTYFPHSIDNGDIDKPLSHYTLKLSGITSETKIQVDAPKSASNACPRMFLFDIKLTKE